MSVEAFSWALSAPVGGNQKIVLLGIANHADPYGRNAYPVLDTLARYACCHRNTARRAVRELVDSAWLIEDGRGPRGQIRYRLPLWRKREQEAPVSYLCVYCGEATATVMDHVVPRSAGGRDGANLVPACVPCNADKGVGDAREWVERRGWDWATIRGRIEGYQNGTLAAGEGYQNGGPRRTTATVPEPSLEPSLESKPSKSKGGSGGDQPTLDPVLEARVEKFLDRHAQLVEGAGATRPGKTKAAREAARWILRREPDAKAIIARLEWALAHPFWSGQVLTLAGFRRGWDRLTVQWRASVERDTRNGREERTNEPIRPVHYD